MTDELIMDDSQAVEDEDGDDPVVASRRRARETLERTRMSDEERESHEARAQANRLAEGDALAASILADQQQRQAQGDASNYQERKAPLEDRAARAEADRLARVVETLPALPRKNKPFTTDEVIAAVGLRLGEVRRDVTRLEKREAGFSYREALEQAIGIVLAKLQKRHAEGEARVTSTEARLAALEARIASIEAKGVAEPEKQTGP